MEAIYFDGLSAVPHTVEIEIDDRNNELVFLSSVFPDKRWNLTRLQFQRLDHCLELIPEGRSTEMLKINGQQDIETILKRIKQTGTLSVYHRLLMGGMRTHVVLAVLIVVAIVLAWFYVLPPVAEHAAVLLPEKYDKYLTSEFSKTYFMDNRIDTVRSEQLTAFARLIDFNNSRPLTYYVVDSPVVNAFALPDGTIVVFTGLLGKMKNPEELVALLSHEAAHVNNRHSVKMLARNLAGYLFISILFSDINGIMAVLAENAESLQSLSYSRSFENEADEQGLAIMINNHIDPQGMTTLFSRLKTEELAIPAFLSTHPVTDDRIANIRTIMKSKSYFTTRNTELTRAFLLLK